MFWLSGVFRLATNKYILLGFIAMTVLGTIYFAIQRDQKIIKEQAKVVDILKHQLTVISMEKENARKTIEVVTKAVEYNSKMLDEVRNQNIQIYASTRENLKAVQDSRLKDLAAAKPGLIQIKINKATDKVFKQLMDETSQFLQEQK